MFWMELNTPIQLKKMNFKLLTKKFPSNLKTLAKFEESLQLYQKSLKITSILI